MTTGQSDNVHAKHNVVRGKQMFNIERQRVMIYKFLKDKETKTKVRFAATAGTAQKGISGSLYIDKDSELAKDSEIFLEIAKENS